MTRPEHVWSDDFDAEAWYAEQFARDSYDPYYDEADR